MNAKITYVQTNHTNASATVAMFSSVTAFPGKRYFAMHGVAKFVVDLEHDAATTFKWYKSQNRGVTWVQLGEEAVAAPGTTATTIREFLVEPYDDWKLEAINGSAAQTTFVPDLVLISDRGPVS